MMDSTENAFLYPITIPIRISPRIGLLFTLIVIGAGIGIWTSGLSFPVKLAFSAVLAGYAPYRYYAWRDQIPQCMTLTVEGRWYIINHEGYLFSACLIGGQYVHQYLVLLQLHYHTGRHLIMITPDCVEADQFRRLCVRVQHLNISRQA